MGASKAETTIPTIDIGAFIDPKAPQDAANDVVEAVRYAAHTYGFFQIVGHGVSEEQQDEILKACMRFYDLPMEDKMDVSIHKCMGRSFRGYEPSGIQTHKKDLLPDTKEAFLVGAEVPPDHPDAGSFSTGPNLWPKAIPNEEFHDPVMRYQAKMVELVKVLLKILARGLPKEWNQPPDVMDDLAVNPSIPMRLLHYAPQPVYNEKQFGVGDHTDFGNVTILLQQEGTEGLEVWYPPTESWIPVPPKKGAYVINMGDTMQKWTAGYYRSARHRVISYGTKHRYSVPFFLNGQLRLKIKPLDGSGEESEVGDHIRDRLMATMGENGKKLH